MSHEDREDLEGQIEDYRKEVAELEARPSLTKEETFMLAKLIAKMGIDPLLDWGMRDALELFGKLGLRLKFVPLEEEGEK